MINKCLSDYFKEVLFMKKTAKVLSVILALIMALSVIPFAFAEEVTPAEEKVAGWKANYALLLDTLYDNTNYTSWQYVDQNKKAIDSTMTAYTVFALYDKAWVNYASKSLELDNAEKILLALIEKATYEFNDGYADEIVSVLETAGDVNDFIQKANKYLNIEAFASSGWGETFKVINTAAKIGNAYQNYRDKFIEAYARVLSVQKANAYYIDLLQYIVDQNSYGILTQAAQKLINDINSSVEDVLEKIAAAVAEDGAAIGADYLIDFAMNSNAYTAVALKVYQTATSIADFLWNTGDQYALIDTVKTAYYFQTNVADWAKAAVNGDDADKALIAVDFLITTRTVSEDALYNLKLAENEGAINKIKNKLYGTVYNDIEINKGALVVMKNMFDNDVADMKKVVRGLYIYCPVSVAFRPSVTEADYLLIADAAPTDYTATANGAYACIYSAYSKEYLKVAYLYNTDYVTLSANAEGYVTLIMDALVGDKVEDWSFTDLKVANGDAIAFNTAYTGTPSYATKNGKTNFNDNFVPSEQPEVTVKEVAEATVEVGKEEAKSFLDKIKEFFENLFAKLFSIFKK